MAHAASRPLTRRAPRIFAAALAAAIGLITLGAAAPAVAADTDTEGFTDSIFGNVQLDREPLEGVRMIVEGNGFSAETVTDADGRWTILVPEGGDYNVTLDEETLPEGIAVIDDTGENETPNIRPVNVGQSGSTVANFFIGEGERNTTSLLDQVIQRFFNGLNFGLLLALVAIGLSLIFGTTGLSNFAHAELVTWGALMTLLFSSFLPLWAALIAALLMSAAFGWANDAGLWKPLRKKGVGLIPLMIVSIGFSLALRYIYQYFVGGQTQQLPGATDTTFALGFYNLTWISVGSMLISVIILVAVAYFLLRTRIGKATRAVSDNPALAAASGIDVDRVIRIVWVLAATLAGLGGILWAYFRPGVSWDMGFQILLLTFAAVVLGGLGTAFGALIGSIVVGMFVELSTLIIPSDMKYVGALVILILVLLVRPQGILGRKERIG